MQKEQKEKKRQFDVSDVNWLQAVFDAVSDIGIVITDMDSRIVVYNTAASFYDRVDQKTARGMHYSQIYQDDDGGFIQRVMREGKPILNQPESYRYADGRTMTSLDSVYPVYEDGRMVCVISFTHYNVEAQQALNKVFANHVREGAKRRRSGESGVRFSFQDILGGSAKLRSVVNRAMRAAGSSAPVFLEGETGTGKEMFAQSIHSSSVRTASPFVAINCAAIPENLLESILFGTTKGSFTGAGDKAGLFEQAKDGTFFLDEINSMPLFLQAKLLRVIQERRVRRLGAQHETEIHCRIIASCNQKVEECFGDGTLRKDLFYRLSVIRLEIPPLRERKEDIGDYLKAFLKKYAEVYERSVTGWTGEFYDALETYEWPGNVRELEHVVESAVVMMNEENALSLVDLPANILSVYYGRLNNSECAEAEKSAGAGTVSDGTPPEVLTGTPSERPPEVPTGRPPETLTGTPPAEPRETQPERPTEMLTGTPRKIPESRELPESGEHQTEGGIKDYLHRQERELLIRNLEKNEWNVTRTAKAMGISRSSLQYRMRRLNIVRPEE